MAQLTTEFQLLDEKYLGNSGYANVYVRVYARVSSEGYDIANNRTKVYAKSTIYYAAGGGYFYSSSGTSKSLSCTGLTSASGSANGTYYEGETTLNEISGYVTHNNDGTKTITASASWSSQPWGWSATASGSATLPPIPRYATVSHSLYEKKMDGTVISWSSDSTIDYIWAKYKKSSESSYTTIEIGSVNASSGRYTITGLDPNTWYDVITIVRRKDSQLTTESAKIQIGTLNIPLIATAPNFTDEDNPKITYTNTSGAEIDSLQACISWTGAADIDYRNINKTGTLEYTFNFTDAERKKLRQACTKNSMQVTFYVRTRENSKTYYSTLNRTMTIVNAKPVFTDFDWQTTNYSNLTGDNKTVIKGYSTVRTIIDDITKAQPQKEATLKSYQTTIGTKSNSTTNLSYPIQYDIANADGATIQVFATDSRDNSTQVVKPVTKFIDYKPLEKTPLEVIRTEQVNSEVSLHFEGIIDLVNFGSLQNLIRDCYYEYKETSSSGGFIQGATTLEPQLTKIEGTRYRIEIDQIIAGDLGAEGFDINNSYLIRLSIFDRLSSIVDTATLGTGSPAVAMYKNNVSLGAPYNSIVGGRVQTNGKDIEYAFVDVNPTENEQKAKVWFKKSKNLYNKYGNLSVTYPLMYPNGATSLQSSGYVRSTSSYYFGYSPGQIVHVEKNTDYVISFEIVNRYAAGPSIITIGFRQSNGNYGALYTQTYQNNLGAYAFKFNTGDNSEILVSLNGVFNSSAAGQWIDYDKVQLEKGTTKTEFEEYVDPKIYTLKDGNVLEEFSYGIVESGKNENGSWVKFSDGTMICRHIANMGSCKFALYSGGLYTDQTNGGYFNWKLPQYFIDRDVEVSALAMSSAYMCTSAGGLSSDLTNLNIFYHTNYACTVSVSLCMTAIGKWK